MHTPRKRFGQHFLINHGIIEKIAHAVNPQEKDFLVEIGPGLGALTKIILPLVKQLHVIELDRDVIPILQNDCKDLGNLIVHEADVLDFDFAALTEKKKLLRIIGNLPYNISTPLIFHLLQYKALIKDMHFMLQKEVVDRLHAHVATKEYSRLSVMVQYHCQVEKLFNVAPGSFNPPPKVASAVVRLTPYENPPHHATNEEQFKTLVHHAFLHRRKTLKNNLKNYISMDVLEKLGIDYTLRPEDISVGDYVRISNAVV